MTSAADVKKRNGEGIWSRTGFLLWQLVQRDLKSRFMGSILGVSWAVVQPVSLVICYWFVFTKMIPRSTQAATEGYVLFLISGLVPWLGFADALSRGTPSLVDNAPMVRKLTFQSEILVVTPCVTAMLFELVGIVLFIIYQVVIGASLWSLWILPFALLIQLALQIGVSWILSVLHVLFRDVMQVLGFALSLGLFLSPIFYSAEGKYEMFFQWNPMTPLLGLFRSALLGDPLPSVFSIVFLLVVVASVFTAGYVFIRRAQPNLADLL
ncbi:MAG: ABC transporter permease [Thermoanaerobaculia bacterium]|nr:ABC transporter permease [Thermoanaerobaculia bacterium]